MFSTKTGESPGVVANVLDSNNIMSEFEFKSRFYFYFRANVTFRSGQTNDNA